MSNHKAGIASACDHGTPTVECSFNAAVDANAACDVGTESRTAAASSTINSMNNKNGGPPTTAVEGSSAEARVALAIANSDAVAVPSFAIGPVLRSTKVGTAKLDYLLADITKERNAISSATANPDTNRLGAMTSSAAVTSASKDAASSNTNGTTAKWD